jgi:hypothetical protein
LPFPVIIFTITIILLVRFLDRGGEIFYLLGSKKKKSYLESTLTWAWLLFHTMDAVPRRVTHGDIPFQERWEYLKPIITQLYIDENKTLTDVAAIMNTDHGFDAE